MNGLAHLNLIHVLDFYLFFMFVLGTLRRIRQYRQIGRLVFTGPGRWPKLLALVKEHRTIFLTWATVLPALLAALLSLVQLIASRQLWPQARLTVGELGQMWLALLIVVPIGAAMLAVDLYGIIVVGSFDHHEMEKYFDQAEYWLRSRTAHVVRIFTLGYVNPRARVSAEVQKSLLEASRLLNTTLWWVNVQIGLRVAFGLALWGSWAVSEMSQPLACFGVRQSSAALVLLVAPRTKKPTKAAEDCRTPKQDLPLTRPPAKPMVRTSPGGERCAWS
jgi:hypothetical protein